jgi:hypothetical protein
MNNARLYTSNDLILALNAQFPAAWSPIVFNSKYCAVTRSWVEKQFTAYIWSFETARSQITYRKRGNQCEHFALRAALEVVDLFSKMPEDQVPADAESVAIVATKYLRADGRGWHEVNLWFHGGVWFPWEPQTRRYFDFTEAERLSVQQPIIP